MGGDLVRGPVIEPYGGFNPRPRMGGDPPNANALP